jgi:hypothetical protein
MLCHATLCDAAQVRVHIFMLTSSLYLIFQSLMILTARVKMHLLRDVEWEVTIRAEEQTGPTAARDAVAELAPIEAPTKPPSNGPTGAGRITGPTGARS